jgi:tRNA dimethylallyltransferase
MTIEHRLRVAALVGPTAVGKTEVSIELAGSLGAEIVSLDSMQVYRGMDIGTAKPGSGDLSKVRHHLIDVFDPTHDVSVAEFQTMARAAIDDIVARGRLPLLVGGAGLYFRAVVDDLRFPPRDRRVRADLEIEAEHLGAEALHERLRTLDPTAADRIEPANSRRTIRALEVISLTGRPFSANDAWDSYESRYDLLVAGLRRDREDLRARITERVGDMVARGLLDEARKLQETGVGVTAAQGLGYKQILGAGPDASIEEVTLAIERATNRFARRQESWFKNDPRVIWFDAAGPQVLEDLITFFRTRVGDSARG